MPIIEFKGKAPKIGDGVFIAPDAWVIGDVTIADDVTILFGAVLRGDLLPISVGKGTNIQEHSMLHTTHGVSPCEVGERVTIGHRAILHGCKVEDRALIGMGATVLDLALVGRETVVGAQSLVTMKSKLEPKSLYVGSPARMVKKLDQRGLAMAQEGVDIYLELNKEYRATDFSRN